jgi:GH15 family glucan-1,4-alpha-glucosidase
MYSIDGGKNLDEYTLDHMRGYRDSRPVRIGNKAHRQFQLDIYGELIDTIYLYNKDGGAITYDFWVKISKNIEFIVTNWRRPDNGMWETRNGEKQFLQSRMMCWVAIDRAIKIAEARSFNYPVLRWREARDTIFDDIYFNFWNEEKECFVQYPGASVVDGSVLLMSLMRILSPEEEKWKKTLEAVDRELRSDVLIFRYRNDSEQGTDHQGWEGTFTMCSFWYVECLAKTGQIQKAREYFSKILAYANPVGLFSEQIGPKGEHLGNFPQAFTHLALISAAIELDKDLMLK